MFEKEIEEYERIRQEYQLILLRANLPLLIIRLEDCAAYIAALKQIKTEGTDEHLIAFFFRTAIHRMQDEFSQKHKDSLPLVFF